MSSLVKFLLCLTVVVGAIQARPRLDGTFLENVRYDLTRRCAGRERDIEKEALNSGHKILKEATKLRKKAVKEGSPECVESARLQAEDQLEEKKEELMNCVRELRESLDADLQPDADIREILAFRSEFKRKVDACKKSAKAELKAIESGFSAAGKACLV